MISITARIFVLTLFGVVLACGGADKQVSLPPTPDISVLMQSATLGAGDVIEIRVYREKELSALYRVSEDGHFDFPLIGAVDARGKTTSALVGEITSRLEHGFLRNPQVSVFVKEFNSKKVFVLGEVKKPGTFRYENQMTIVQAVTLAGGLKALAARNRLILTRIEKGNEQKYEIPFDKISEGGVSNVFLQPGDIIFVPQSWL